MANLDCPDDDPRLDRDPDARALSYLEVALASIAPQASRGGRRAAGRGRRRSLGAGARAGRALRRALRAAPRPAGPERGAQHRRGALDGRAGGVRRRRRPREPGMARGAARRGARAPRGGRLHRPDPAAHRGPAGALVRARGPPITTLELGGEDTDARYAWGANMAVRRSALERVGPFEESLEHGGDEQEWQDRFRAASGGSARVLYVAGAVRRAPAGGADARLAALSRAQHVRGRAARRFDARRGQAPSLGRELLTLAGSAGHVVRRRCPAGLTMVAHSAGRLREGLREALRQARRPARPLAGAGRGRTPAKRRTARRPTTSCRARAGRSAGWTPCGAACATRRSTAGSWPAAGGCAWRARRVASRPGGGCWCSASSARSIARWPSARRPSWRARATRSSWASARPAERGKFENLNRLLAGAPGRRARLAAGGGRRRGAAARLPRPLPVPVRALLAAARPAGAPPELARGVAADAAPAGQRGARDELRGDRPGDGLRASATFPTLLPFPELRMGWGLDAHWAALAREHGWRCGVTDAVAIRHRAAPAADAYSREAAVAEARAFLAERPYLSGRRGATHPDDAPPLVKVLVVAEFYPSRRDPVLGIWAHRQALAARDAGAEVRVLVLHRLVPPRASLAAGPAAAAGALARARARAARAGARRAGDLLRSLRLARPRALLCDVGGVGLAGPGPGDGPAAALVPLRSRARAQRRAGRRCGAPPAGTAPAERAAGDLRARRRRALHGRPRAIGRRERAARAGGAPAWCSPTARASPSSPRARRARDARGAPRRRRAGRRAPAAHGRAADARDGRPPGRAQAPRRRPARAGRAERRATPRCATRSSATAPSGRRSRARRAPGGGRAGRLPRAAGARRGDRAGAALHAVRDALDRGGVRRGLRRGDGRRGSRRSAAAASRGRRRSRRRATGWCSFRPATSSG